MRSHALCWNAGTHSAAGIAACGALRLAQNGATLEVYYEVVEQWQAVTAGVFCAPILRA